MDIGESEKRSERKIRILSLPYMIGLSLATVVGVGIAFNELDPIRRLSASVEGVSYQEFKLKEEEYMNKKRRLPVEKFFREYDVNQDGVIDSLESKMSLPVQEK